MNNAQEALYSLLKTTQLGQARIRSVLDRALGPEFSDALHDQLRELCSIESEARTLVSQRGWELPELGIAAKLLSDRKFRKNLPSGQCNCEIADRIILSNTRALVDGLKQLHRYPHNDRIRILSQKLIDCHTAAIRQMEPFL